MQKNYIATNKIAIYVFLPVLFVQAISAIVNIQLFQDGGSYLFEIIQTKSFAIRHHRISAGIIQMPTLVLIKILNKYFGGINENLSLIRTVFCLSYSLIPIIALSLSWILVRRKNEHLFVWPAIIILYINLVNFSGVSELLIAMQLSCPLMLGAITIPGRKFFLILLFILTPFIFFLHPLVAGIFITLAIGIFYAGYKNQNIKTPAWRIATAIAVGAALRVILNLYLLTAYEHSFLVPKERDVYLFESSIEIRIFLLSSILISVALIATKTSFQFLKRPRSIYLITMFLVVTSGLLLISQYAHREFPLKTGLAIFASLFVLSLMAFDSIKNIIASEIVYRLRLVMVITIMFSVVILVKAMIWQSSVKKLNDSISENTSPCIELNSNKYLWLQNSPYKIINTWALPSLALIVQDTQPRKLLLEKENCKIYYQTGMARFDEWTVIPKKYISPSVE